MPNSAWCAISDVLDSTYWSEMWNLQEALFAERLLFLGKRSAICFDVMVKYLRRLIFESNRYSSHHIGGLTEEEWNGFQNRFDYDLPIRIDIRQFIDFVGFLHGPMTLSDPDQTQLSIQRMTLFVPFQCKDPRDFIAACGNLLKFPMKPNYNQTLEEMYRDFAIACIKGVEKTNVLYYSGIGLDHNSSSGMPSWVPDWRMMENQGSWLAM